MATERKVTHSMAQQVSSIEAKSNVSSKQNNGTNVEKDKSEVKAKVVALNITPELHEAVTSKALDLGYPVQWVGKCLLQKWVRGEVVVALPPDQIPEGITGKISELLAANPKEADEVLKFLDSRASQRQAPK